MTTKQRIRAIVLGTCVAGVGAGAGFSGGCVGYANYPPVEGATLAVNNPNAPPTDELMVLSLRWLVDKYPPQAGGPVIANEERFAINLPNGVRRSVYELTAERVGSGAVPLTAENCTTLPIYHIQQIWVRERVAKVTVLRPRQELGKTTKGEPVYEGITLHVEGGFQPWRIVRWQTWEVGVVETPEFYFCPTDEWPKKAKAPVEENGQPSEPPVSEPVAEEAPQ